jgi:hypothetical protein
MQIGYNAPHNENCEIADNVLFRSGLSVNRYKAGGVRNNLIVSGVLNIIGEGNVKSQDNAVSNDRMPEEPGVILLANQHDRDRANLAIFNWQREPIVRVSAGDFLKNGERFRLMDPLDFYGEPVFEGRCEGDGFGVPMQDEFGVFVVLKD